MPDTKERQQRARTNKARHEAKGLGDEAEVLREIAFKILDIAKMIDKSETNGSQFATVDLEKKFNDIFQSSTTFRLYTYAMNEYQRRRRRDSLFPADLFGEASWDMLLFLFISKIKGMDIRVTHLCESSGVPSTTALRYIDALLKHDLVVKERSLNDNRSMFVRLTQTGFDFMSKALDR
ncbi:MarR family winged helix-turn-helix transcriptional regulator [Novosphingobium album (ex Liu et al. 2023)]|uniref:MarR family winged helix-turn-helix transcriptional regulator n=1 Tax=Novosphingobium album (ex Liu et al. 2023) TaxID=3031130 RepID=A0ABT5WLN5_9SPHN|nr:MarR family winged helix-turn-helix transcriptional regulator [Novosphingobium album (ex Liu et al. 2023)]MDE8650945.1 MarR family winged helix-turn-helix transcriptional regulator [Novosphingobium album (ex Liu et al. 2023)]